MSAIDYKALAERVAQRAIYADNNADPNNKAWAADLRTVVSLLNGMAGQKPQAEPKRDWSAIDAAICEYLDGYELIGENDAGADACYTPTERECDLIYDAINGLLADEHFMRLIAPHPAPAVPQAEPDDDDALVLGEPDMLTPEDVRRLVPQAEPKREALSDDEILDLATAAGLRFSMYSDDVETRAAIKRLARAIEREHGIGVRK